MEYDEPTPEEDLNPLPDEEFTDEAVAVQEESPAYVSDGPGGFERVTQEWVTIEHPDLENSTTTVTPEAFDEVWADKGWVVVEAEDVPPPSKG